MNEANAIREAAEYLDGLLKEDVDTNAAAREAVEQALSSYDGEQFLECEVSGFFTADGNPLAFSISAQPE